MKAIGYQRVSTVQQVDGEGLGVQREKIEAWCRYQGIPLLVIEEDAGISGANVQNRPGFRRALRAVLELGSEGVLVVAKLDRLGRNAADVQDALDLLLHAGVRVVSLGDGIDSASGMGAMLLKVLTNILATFSELEKETIRVRLLEARQRADRENRRYASEPRYGRRVSDDGRTLVADADEQALVQRVQALRGAGLSYRAICKVLTDEGSKPRRAPAWSPTTVRRIATGLRAPKKSLASRRIERVRAELLAENDERPAA